MTDSQTLKVLIASFLEPELVTQIEEQVSGIDVFYEPSLLGKPEYPCDHSSLPKRTPEEEAKWKDLLRQADVMFDFDFSHKEDLPELATNLKWIQATSAGIGQYVKRNSYDTRTNWTFTTASGVHSRPLAEFAIMAILMFSKDYFHLQDEKKKHHWQRGCGDELAGKRLGIVGLGKIGREVARCAKTFDMITLGNRRNPANEKLPFVDQVYGPHKLPKLLEQSDYLCISTPHTSETEGLIGPTEIRTLPRGSVLINISRGSIVDQSALINALKSGHLKGAALDVFAIEPLPSDSPLWDMPNVIISPHSASTAYSENRKLVQLFIENLKRYQRGESLANTLDKVRSY